MAISQYPAASWGSLRRNRSCLPEIATSAFGLLAMTSLGALHIRRKYLQICSCQRRSLTAATDAIGAYRFHGGRYESAVPPRDCTPRALPRASRSGRHVGLWPPRNDKSGGVCHFDGGLYGLQVHRREGHAPPLQRTAGGLRIFHSSFFSLQYSFFTHAPPLQRITGSYGKNSTLHSQFSPSGGRLSPNRYLQ